jgi:hypothetical protein
MGEREGAKTGERERRKVTENKEEGARGRGIGGNGEE